MDVKAKWFKLDDQKPLIQLITSMMIIVIPGTLIYYFFAFSGTFIFKTAFSDMISFQAGVIDSNHVAILKYNQVIQEIALFIIPGLILAGMFRHGNESYLKINRAPDLNHLLLAILLALIMIPVTMYTGILNSKMVLPDSFSGIERWMKTKEDIATDLTALFIQSSNSIEFALNIFILALLPSIAEEIIFRGILQRLFCSIFRSPHFGIWITAVFFSAIHLQFFGFLPRLLLGLSFGYLFFWGGNLWLPITAHFINNLIPVILSFVMGWTKLNEKTEKLSSNQFAVPLAAVFLSILILYHFRAEYRKNLNE